MLLQRPARDGSLSSMCARILTFPSESQLNKHFHIWAGRFAYAAGVIQCYRGLELVSSSDELLFSAGDGLDLQVTSLAQLTRTVYQALRRNLYRVPFSKYDGRKLHHNAHPRSKFGSRSLLTGCDSLQFNQLCQDVHHAFSVTVKHRERERRRASGASTTAMLAEV